MEKFDRLPAFPLIANDPYFSIWLPADKPTQANTVHWSGARKWIRGSIWVDGQEYRFLGKSGIRAAETVAVKVTPTRTTFDMLAGGVKLSVCFWTPALPDDLDALSTPISFVDFSVVSTTDDPHEVIVRLSVPESFCYDGEANPGVFSDCYRVDGMNYCYFGQINQKVLCHSGDRITIDWGYLYMASSEQIEHRQNAAHFAWDVQANAEVQKSFVMLGYDDIASVNYFGVPCRAWFARDGQTLFGAMKDFGARHDALLDACKALDARVLEDAAQAGGEDYQLIVSAAWRHTFAAHKLIATPEGEMAFLSKENDSNGCIGTVDLSYPSAPLLLRYCPELVNALCRPILRFASMPVWDKDYAPHDVGRYPYATGQVYALHQRPAHGEVVPPYYLYPPQADIYNSKFQMPVEESGNMLIMLAAAIHFGADPSLARTHADTLRKWVRYLDEFGEDPGEQLCTDDFAGHLAHNVNLAAKALVGVACYGLLLKGLNDTQGAAKWTARAHAMAKSWIERVGAGGGTPLTFGGQGWSMKYNLAWDLVLNLELLTDDFYQKETESYLARQNLFGLPLDSRADYSKSDWLAWCAAMAKDRSVRAKLLRPLADYLRKSNTRVPFSDWYDTISGDYVEFIARSVQGGVFMPMLIAADQ